MNIGFLGLNSKSLSFAILFEKSGHNCFIHDDNEDIVFNLNQKIFLTDEFDLQSEFVNSKKISGSTDPTEVIKISDTIFSFIDCPTNLDNSLNTTEIFDTIQKFYLSSHIDILLYNKNFILSSALNIGDCKKINEKIAQFGIKFGYMPNFLTEGSSFNSLVKNNLFVFGTNSHELSNDFSYLIRKIKKESKLYIMSYESAELSKLAISSIIAHKIVLSNLVGDLMTSIGLEKEIPLVLKSMSDDERVGKYNLEYGMSYGGPNLGKELKVFSNFIKEKKVKVDIFETTEQANKEHLEYLKYYYMSQNPTKEVPFVFNSLGYKRNSKILEDSPSFKLCMELLEEGYIINVIEDFDIANKFSNLSESYNNRLKFYRKGSSPEGIKIKI